MVKFKFKNVDPARSRTMSAIRGKNTNIEIIVRKALFKKGLRYRIHYKYLPGIPDIVFVSKKIAIFCDSDFWHGKNWATKKPKIKSNRDYWIPKIERTIERDREINKELKKMGWTVLRFWGSEIIKDTNSVLDRIIKVCEAK